MYLYSELNVKLTTANKTTQIQLGPNNIAPAFIRGLTAALSCNEYK